VAAALTTVVLWRADPAAVIAAGAGARLGWIAAAAVLVVADRALMAYRWMALLDPIARAARPPFAAVLRIFFTSTFVGTFLPASVGGDAVRAYDLARQGVDGAVALASVLVDRLLGVVSMLVLGVLGLAVARDLASDRGLVGALAAAAAGCAVATAVLFSPGAAELVRATLARLRLERAGRLAVRLVEAVRQYRRFHGTLVVVLIASIAVQGLRVVQAFLLGRALGLEVGLPAYFAFVPLIMLVMLLPVTVNGLGTSQVAFVWFFGRAGVDAPAAFALSILFVALGVVGNLPGGLLYATKRAPTGKGSEA
jgi:hypothetical protein